MTMSMTTSHDHDGAIHSDGAKVIVTTLEHPIQIHLWEDRTRGELWVPTFDPAGRELLADAYLRIAGTNAVRNGQRTVAIQAVRPGTHRVAGETRGRSQFT